MIYAYFDAFRLFQTESCANITIESNMGAKRVPGSRLHSQPPATPPYSPACILSPLPHPLSRVYTIIRDATRHSSIVHTMRDIIARRHVAAGDLDLNVCFDPTWHCVYLTDIPQKITSIRIIIRLLFHEFY